MGVEVIPMDKPVLTHAGVKGMKWGRRKAKDSSSDSGDRKAAFKKGAKIAGGVAVGVAVAAGSIALVSTLNKRGSTPVSNLASNPATAAGRDFLDLSFGSTSRSGGSSSSGGLNLGANRSSASNSYPSRPSGGPSLATLSDIMNGGPRVSFNSSNGRYETS